MVLPPGLQIGRSISDLDPASPGDRRPRAIISGPAAAPKVAVPPRAAEPADGVGSLLGAMERAQDLAVGDPRADEPGVLVDRILIELPGEDPNEARNIQARIEDLGVRCVVTDTVMSRPGVLDTLTDVTAVVHLTAEVENLRGILRDRDRFHDLIGRSRGMQEVYDLQNAAFLYDAQDGLTEFLAGIMFFFVARAVESPRLAWVPDAVTPDEIRDLMVRQIA